MLLSPRLLVLSCSYEFMLSCFPVGMPSCYRAPKLSYRNESGNALMLLLSLLLVLLALRLPFSPLALSSSHAKAYAPTVTRFPFLDSTGFQNRAPVEAKRSFLKIKVLLSRGRLREPSERLQELSKRLQRGSKSSQRGSKRAPKTFQEHHKMF